MIKRGVRLHGICPQMFLAADIIKDLWKSHNYPFCITSGIEGKHKRTSEHWSGNALDFRTWLNATGEQMSKALKTALRKDLQARLGDEYYVLMEKDHLHVHYSPLKAL